MARRRNLKTVKKVSKIPLTHGQVRRQVMDYLRWKGWEVFYHQQGLGSEKGFPDLTALRGGYTIYVEVKTENDNLSFDQQVMRARIVNAGGRFIVARSIDDLKAEAI